MLRIIVSTLKIAVNGIEALLIKVLSLKFYNQIYMGEGE